MRTALALVAAHLLLGLTPAVQAARAAAPRSACEAGRTLMASSQVRVYRSGTSAYACWVRGRRVRKLVTTQERGSELFVVTGRRVAWSTRFCGGLADITCDTTVRVLDVRTGLVLLRSKVPEQGHAVRLVLTRRRGVAWIERVGKTVRVVAHTRTGKRLVIAEDPAIRPNSLALSGNTLYWLLGDTPQTAEMP